MVEMNTIIQPNQQVSDQHREDDRVSGVFGATTGSISAGILKTTITIHRAPVFYVLGRSSSCYATRRNALEKINLHCTIVFVETDTSLISGVDHAFEHAQHAEKKVY
ncbi:hypothetical protein F5Y16DRAFT_404331 [Xylariaceae sp. FL0255]|nr:hypothetical protein F5Y16DRAFT_404331 [Xylariaceae sp. FL0255]